MSCVFLLAALQLSFVGAYSSLTSLTSSEESWEGKFLRLQSLKVTVLLIPGLAGLEF